MLSMDAWTDIITENGKHLGPSAEFNSAQFQEMMKGELWRFSRRELNNVISVSGDEQSRSMLLMLKIMEASTRATLAEMMRLMTSLHSLVTENADARTGIKPGKDSFRKMARVPSAPGPAIYSPSIASPVACIRGAEGEEALSREHVQHGDASLGGVGSHSFEALVSGLAETKQV